MVRRKEKGVLRRHRRAWRYNSSSDVAARRKRGEKNLHHHRRRSGPHSCLPQEASVKRRGIAWFDDYFFCFFWAKQSVKGSAEGVHIKPHGRDVKIVEFNLSLFKFMKVHVHAITQNSE